MNNRLLKISAAATMLAVSDSHIRRLMHKGILQYVDVGSSSNKCHRRVLESSVLAMLKPAKTKPRLKHRRRKVKEFF